VRNLDEQVKQIRIEAGLLSEEMAARKAFLELTPEEVAAPVGGILAGLERSPAGGERVDVELDACHLELEITESLLMDDPEESASTLRDLNQMGIQFAIDDFGAGYSSLSYLKRFSIHTLKIDQSFVRDITADPDDAAIVKAVIAMARSLKLRVVAEGVETAEQLEFLRAHECEGMQGYYFSKPMPTGQSAPWLDQWQAA
jgi:EAL domain-containing protein (putative c-di-GMP-specific phosphodiesterase class I)